MAIHRKTINSVSWKCIYTLKEHCRATTRMKTCLLGLLQVEPVGERDQRRVKPTLSCINYTTFNPSPCTTINVPIMCTMKENNQVFHIPLASVGEILADIFMTMCFKGRELFDLVYSLHLQMQLAVWLLLATFVLREV